ncbi:hypothetical protein CBOM_01411 [Ceraceosorus bombacis]|uniref:Uncharacterized protein n=1 Tax=Ceraceosorus bombacis TaxID=401625 RepID=A0A0N7L9D6_9BASI|nr:hypothetical protein CBOM_01411 [Ceraceosorus bombacis]
MLTPSLTYQYQKESSEQPEPVDHQISSLWLMSGSIITISHLALPRQGAMPSLRMSTETPPNN